MKHIYLALLVLIPTAAAVTLGWDPSPGAAGYRLYYGATHGIYTNVIDAGNSTTQAVGGLTVGEKYYFVVTAYNSNGIESRLSSELMVSPAPLPPPRLTILPPWVTLTLEGGLSVTSRLDAISSTQGFYRGFVQ